MKYGIRTPSLSKSIKNRTTGYVKRNVKKSLSPYYGSKGIGIIKSPKKYIYNHIYNKTSFSIIDDKSYNKSQNKSYNSSYNIKSSKNEKQKTKKSLIEEIKKIHHKRKTIQPDNKTHYFSSKAKCSICNKSLDLATFRSRYQLIDGWLCMKCLKKIFQKEVPLLPKIYTVEDIILKNKD